MLRFCVWAMIFAGLAVSSGGCGRCGQENSTPAGAICRGLCRARHGGASLRPVPRPFCRRCCRASAFPRLAVGFALGLHLLAALHERAYLRRSAAFSIADLVGTRFPIRWSRAARSRSRRRLRRFRRARRVSTSRCAPSRRSRSSIAASAPPIGLILLVLLLVPGGLAGVIWLWRPRYRDLTAARLAVGAEASSRVSR